MARKNLSRLSALMVGTVAWVCTGWAGGTKAKAQEDLYPDFGIIASHGTPYIVFNIALSWTDNVISFPEESVTAARRLSLILNNDVSVNHDYYHQNDWGVGAARFALPLTVEGTISSVLVGNGEEITKTMRVINSVTEVRTRRINFPDGTMTERDFLAFPKKANTYVFSEKTQPLYQELSQCESRRENAETMVAQDPAKKVFWSTCHPVGYGFYMAVHYYANKTNE